MNNQNIRSHYDVIISNDKAEHYEKIVSVKVLVIVIIDCLMQGICFICGNFKKNITLKLESQPLTLTEQVTEKISHDCRSSEYT